MNWERISNIVRAGSLAAGFMGIGMWVQSIHDGAASIPWFHQQAALAHKLQAVDLPKAKAHAECEHKRADIAETTAIRSEQGKDVNLNAIPDCPEPPKNPKK